MKILMYVINQNHSSLKRICGIGVFLSYVISFKKSQFFMEMRKQNEFFFFYLILVFYDIGIRKLPKYWLSSV